MRKAQYVIRGIHAPAVKFQAHTGAYLRRSLIMHGGRAIKTTRYAELQLQKYGNAHIHI